MKKLLIPLTIALITGCAATADKAKSVTSNVADAGKAVAAKAMPSNKKPDMMAMMKHVSPMPSLMPIAMGNVDMLELSKEQIEALAAGRDERHDKVHGLANEIVADEKAVTQAALEGKTREELNQMSEAIMEKRLAIIDAKANCRDIMRKTLNDEQWSEVVDLAKAAQK